MVAAITRTSTSTGVVAPTRVTVPDSSARSSLGWSAGRSSPISSRNRVPPFAHSKTPGRSESAPVNAPRTWPNSADSISVGATAPQSNTTYGRPARGETSWIARASTSLPVPVSPSRSTAAFDAAAFRAAANSRRIATERPTASPNRSSVDSSISSSVLSRRATSAVSPSSMRAPSAR